MSVDLRAIVPTNTGSPPGRARRARWLRRPIVNSDRLDQLAVLASEGFVIVVWTSARYESWRRNRRRAAALGCEGSKEEGVSAKGLDRLQ